VADSLPPPSDADAKAGLVADLMAEVATLRARVASLEAAERELKRLKSSNSWRVTEPLRAAKARLGGRR
jgi:hypothetical protein